MNTCTTFGIIHAKSWTGFNYYLQWTFVRHSPTELLSLRGVTTRSHYPGTNFNWKEKTMVIQGCRSSFKSVLLSSLTIYSWPASTHDAERYQRIYCGMLHIINKHLFFSCHGTNSSRPRIESQATRVTHDQGAVKWSFNLKPQPQHVCMRKTYRL